MVLKEPMDIILYLVLLLLLAVVVAQVVVALALQTMVAQVVEHQKIGELVVPLHKLLVMVTQVMAIMVVTKVVDKQLAKEQVVVALALLAEVQ